MKSNTGATSDKTPAPVSELGAASNRPQVKSFTIKYIKRHLPYCTISQSCQGACSATCRVSGSRTDLENEILSLPPGS